MQANQQKNSLFSQINSQNENQENLQNPTTQGENQQEIHKNPQNSVNFLENSQENSQNESQENSRILDQEISQNKNQEIPQNSQATQESTQEFQAKLNLIPNSNSTPNSNSNSKKSALATSLKAEFQGICEGYTRHFIKQGSFNLYHSKELDRLIKRAFDGVLKEFFEDFLPKNVPLCVIATKAYSALKIGANEALPLLFIYKDIKAYNTKPIIKALIALLNDIGLVISQQICEIGGIFGKGKELKPFGLRYLCGSKLLFKQTKNEAQKVLNAYKMDFANEILAKFTDANLNFVKQEFNIKKDFGGIENYADLDTLLALFKNSPKNYALNFITEKEVSELRLALDYILSLQSAMNIQSGKDSDIFLLANAQEISLLMQKKDKKGLNASLLIVQKALNSLHTIALYSTYIAKCLKNEHIMGLNKGIFIIANSKIYLDKRAKNADLKDFLAAFNDLSDENYGLSVEIVMALKRLKCGKNTILAAMPSFKMLLYRRYSFAMLKALWSSGLLKELIKAYAPLYFLPDDESVYSRDENALLCLRAYEERMGEFEILKELEFDEKIALKIAILLSASDEKNELSLANIYRAICVKVGVSTQGTEFGLRLCLNFNLMREFILKEDIYNENIITAFIARLKNPRNVRILYALSHINATALNIGEHFYFKSLDALLNNALGGFESAEFLDESTRRMKKEQTLRRSRAFLECDEYLQDKITHIKSNLFIIKNPFEKIIKVAKIARENDFEFWLDNEKNFVFEMVGRETSVDLQGILGALSGLNLVFMSFFPLFDDKMYLKFEYANELSDVQKERFEGLLRENLRDRLGTQKRLKKPMIKKDELKFDSAYSKTYAKLNLNARDQQGLMAFVMKVFKDLKLTLSAAKIQTIRGRTRNTFYLRKSVNLNEQTLIKSLSSE